jgi:hypothetical protein
VRRVRAARLAARAFGWLFVVFIAYHALLAANRARDAGHDGNWAYAIELAAIAIVATALVIGAVVVAVRGRSRTARSRTP